MQKNEGYQNEAAKEFDNVELRYQEILAEADEREKHLR
jgi:hypothetical protein